MSIPAIVIACRDSSEGTRLREAIGQPSAPVFHKSAPLMDYLSDTPDACLIMTPLMFDDTATSILTKRAIIQPGYNILYVCQCRCALNLLRAYGCGCTHIVGPKEHELLNALLQPPDDVLSELVTPPFFIDDDESSLKTPSAKAAFPVHVTCLGAQAISTCANALLNIRASSTISFSVVAPQSAWVQAHLKTNMQEFTQWHLETKPRMVGGAVTLCNNFNALAAIEPTANHFILCHGHLSPEEQHYIMRQPSTTRIFVASNEGYFEKENDRIKAFIAPERLWDVIISALYGN